MIVEQFEGNRRFKKKITILDAKAGKCNGQGFLSGTLKRDISGFHPGHIDHLKREYEELANSSDNFKHGHSENRCTFELKSLCTDSAAVQLYHQLHLNRCAQKYGAESRLIHFLLRTGSLFHTRCTVCHHVEENYKAPICPALEGRGAPDPNTPEACIPAADLPRCEQPGCGGLLRPHVVWFGEPLFHDVLQQVNQTLDECDLCLLVGTSSVVYPAAAFAPKLALRGVPVAEFNLEDTPVTGMFQYHFQGKAGDLLPIALAMNDPPADVLEMV
ncbi:NAD-dependent protein deacylase sirtuin-5, mitochondrial-like [Corticium candelabrum]|uniref:NAD-dependent protein deacylase sirtuin-5, mitochondrial-like n=1 Tax=Corticium candelabrum TaxID=121492 RepID=UPI002E271BE5|nr:NAD-dependent protein deacylase sirtuin-5, mitochondrial-like [Corticium candelabrum]